MPQSANQDDISLELQETIQKLNTILAQLKAGSGVNQPSTTLVKQLVNTTEAIQNIVSPTPLLRRVPLALVGLLFLILVGLGVYFYNFWPSQPKVVQTPPIVKPSQEVITPEPVLSEPESIPSEEVQEVPLLEEPVEQVQPELTEVSLTPEQSFLAGLKQSLNVYNSQLQEELINSVMVDFEHSALKVKLNQSWFDLSEVQQNRLAAEIWQRAQNLAFSKLELADSQGSIVARSPVVGKDMVIFQRTLASD
jgi:hypothetical protein